MNEIIEIECKNCNGQGVDPNDDGTGSYMCTSCNGNCKIYFTRNAGSISKLLVALKPGESIMMINITSNNFALNMPVEVTRRILPYGTAESSDYRIEGFTKNNNPQMKYSDLNNLIKQYGVSLSPDELFLKSLGNIL